MTRRVLVVSPHPDDESIGCGGTLRRHVVDGEDVRVVFLTSGERGIRGVAPEEAGARREDEARRAGEILGITSMEFWRGADGALQVSDDLVRRLGNELNAYRPDIVYVTHENEAHDDHRAAGRLVTETLRGRSGRRPEVLMFEVWTPLASFDEVIDITPYIDLKLAAIRAHRSQCEVLRFDDAFAGLARYRGEMYYWPKGEQNLSGSYAEVFRKLN